MFAQATYGASVKASERLRSSTSEVADRRWSVLTFSVVITPPSSPTTTIEVMATDTRASISVNPAWPRVGCWRASRFERRVIEET